MNNKQWKVGTIVSKETNYKVKKRVGINKYVIKIQSVIVINYNRLYFL